MRDIEINGKKISSKSPIFLIAEAGVNHNGKLSIAKKLVDTAVKANVDAIKFQTFNPDELLIKTTPKVEYQKSKEDDKENFYELIKRLSLTEEDFKSLKDYCSQNNIIFLSTPFDAPSVEFLDKLDVPAYKVGSGDMNNFVLLKLICSKAKPIFLSTGMATLEEVKESVNFIKKHNIEDIIIFQCTTNYPSNYEELNLNVINTYNKEFPEFLIGFSDHSLGIEASIGAAAKGVKAIEKHFTLDKNMDGPDHKASLDPEELITWVQAIRKLEKALGNYKKIPSENELSIAKVVRKSIICIKDIKIGEKFTKDNIGVKRPGTGIPPKYYEEIIGKESRRNINIDSIIKWEDFK